MIYGKTAKVYMNGSNMKRYKPLGYNVSYGEYADIKVEDLSDSSTVNVLFKCDYCGNIFEREWGIYIRDKKKCPVQKDACKECFPKKLEESMVLRYGVKNSMNLESTKEKIKNTNIERYGVENARQNEAVKEKFKNTCLERYGTTSPLKNEQIKQKFINTNIEKYGGKSPMCDKDVREKAESTNLEKYGVKNCLQNEEIKAKVEETNLRLYGSRKIGQSKYCIDKRAKTNLERYGCVCTLQVPEVKERAQKTLEEKYGVTNCMQSEEIRTRALQTRIDNYGVNGGLVSSQQIYLWNLYGGEINYPFHGYLADIMFTEDSIIIEYSGSGHDIRVKYGQVTEQEFTNSEEVRRNVFLQNGYKEFEIISKTDNLPSDDFLLRLKNRAFDILQNTSNVYYGYNIDTNEEFYK